MRPNVTVLFIIVFTMVLSSFDAAQGATEEISGSGITVTVSSSGDYSVAKDSPAFTYSGSLSQSLGSLQETAGGTDGIGPYQELTFTYDSGNYEGSIKVYTNNRPVCLFTTTCLGAQTDLGSYFPNFTSQPSALYHHGYSGKWCVEQWTRDGIATDSPRIYFDDNKGTAIISAAANYMDAYLEDDAGGIKSSLQSWATGLPDGYTHRTIVVIDNGILDTFDKWGTALCDLQGKTSPANDADMGLKYIGYWTDNGAAYYYNSSFGGYSNYDELLIAVKNQYHNNLKIRLGYMQLDSWWYIKDPSDPWNKIGCYLYEPVPSFFPAGLADFQSRLGMPLITHNRWIGGSVSGDVWSPYRDVYDFSNGVSIDPDFWNEIIGNIASWGVKTYEQDWLDINAKTDNVQGHGELFMKSMAEKCAANNVTMQYCMAVPKHYMQATKYDHVTSLRCLQDRFDATGDWPDLFWKTPFIHAIGSWPWVDVFRSNEDGNFMLCVLSGGMVGMADSIGSEDTANILKAVRRDGVVVKPDIPIRPSDNTFLNRASSGSSRITAYTYSETDGKRIVYVFDYNPPSGTSFSPSEFGLSGDIYFYDYLNDTGYKTTAETSVGTGGSTYKFYVITPIEYSGIGLIGDKGKWVTAGKQRIAGISEGGGAGMTLTVQFGAFDAANADEPAEIIGYSPDEPTIIPGADATVTASSYSPTTKIFRFTLEPSSSYSGEVSRDVTITLDNYPPVVDAGQDQSIYPLAAAILDPNVTDDGLPLVDPEDPYSPPIGITTTWTKQDGPGEVIFDDPCTMNTNSWFSQWGQYTLRLTAFDGAVESYDDIDVFVYRPGDLDGDNDVDDTDLTLFAGGWLSNDCDSLNDWCDGTDQTASGKTNMADYAIIAFNWLLGVEPAAPTNLVAVGVNSQILLDWYDNIETDLDHYDIYRSTTQGSGYSLIDTNITTSDYVDNTVTNDITYYYIVKAVDSSGFESDYSNEASATAHAVIAYQAEDATINNGYVSSDGSGWNGIGYVDLNEGGYVEFTVSVASAGVYNLEFNATGARDNMAARITVNGDVVNPILAIPNRGSWNTNWIVVTEPGVTLNAGTNTIRFEDNGDNQPQIDQLEL